MQRLVRIGVFVLLLLCVAGLSTALMFVPRYLTGSNATETFASGPALVGDPAPDFSLQTLDGETLKLSDMKGTAVVLNFWASWCGPCKDEMPALQSVARKYENQGVKVLAVNQQESPEVARQYLRENNLDFLVLLDSRGRLSETYRVRGIPATFFIDKNGVLQYLSAGSLNESAFDRRIRDLIAP